MFGEKITANIDMCFVHITIAFINLIENDCIVDA